MSLSTHFLFIEIGEKHDLELRSQRESNQTTQKHSIFFLTAQRVSLVYGGRKPFLSTFRTHNNDTN